MSLEASPEPATEASGAAGGRLGAAAGAVREHRPLRACWRHRAAAGLDGKEGAALDLERVPVGAVHARRAEEQLCERHAVDSGDLLAGPVVPHLPRVRLHGEGGHLRRRRLGQLRAAPLPCYPQRGDGAARCNAAKHGDDRRGVLSSGGGEVAHQVRREDTIFLNRYIETETRRTPLRASAGSPRAACLWPWPPTREIYLM